MDGGVGGHFFLGDEVAAVVVAVAGLGEHYLFGAGGTALGVASAEAEEGEEEEDYDEGDGADGDADFGA